MAEEAPRHGEAIIEAIPDNFGGQKFVALTKFQRFLDSLSTSTGEPLDNEDLQQLIESANGNLRGLVNVLKSRVDTNTDNISDNSDNIGILLLGIVILQVSVIDLTERTEDLEQLIHVN